MTIQRKTSPDRDTWRSGRLRIHRNYLVIENTGDHKCDGASRLMEGDVLAGTQQLHARDMSFLRNSHRHALLTDGVVLPDPPLECTRVRVVENMKRVARFGFPGEGFDQPGALNLDRRLSL